MTLPLARIGLLARVETLKFNGYKSEVLNANPKASHPKMTYVKKYPAIFFVMRNNLFTFVPLKRSLK